MSSEESECCSKSKTRHYQGRDLIIDTSREDLETRGSKMIWGLKHFWFLKVKIYSTASPLSANSVVQATKSMSATAIYIQTLIRELRCSSQSTFLPLSNWIKETVNHVKALLCCGADNSDPIIKYEDYRALKVTNHEQIKDQTSPSTTEYDPIAVCW